MDLSSIVLFGVEVGFSAFLFVPWRVGAGGATPILR